MNYYELIKTFKWKMRKNVDWQHLNELWFIELYHSIENILDKK